ncbi:MAG: decaprenyl-phosphate phosphoribosyltransferase [Candidatus Dojkabacteria bacterium]|nr:decaprenyl-phosphate phosphoribosyltransferase [Candidatus Dojkabacteria bacterium]
MTTFKAIIKALRPKQWVKNIFVFPALVFAAEFINIRALVLTICAFFLFSFTASSIYIINDIIDYENDRKHPKKKFRPIASGELNKGVALLISVVLGASSILTALVIHPMFALILLVYVITNLLYSYVFKHIVIVDIILVAIGFVLRAVGGAVVIDVTISSWFLVITFLLTLFLAIMKRRQEFVEINKNGGEKRKVLEHYSVEMLDQMSNIIIPAVLVSYVFYTFNTFHTQYFIFTIPLVIYGIFRYLYLVHKKDMGESPTETLLTDFPLAFVVIMWGLVSMGLLYFFE